MISFDVGTTYIDFYVMFIFSFICICVLTALVVSSRCSAFPLWQDMFIGLFIVSIVNKDIYHRA
jgi:hypothetical protein